MKMNVISLLVLSLIAISSCQEQIDIEKEKEAIKAVIENQSLADYARNYEENINSFIQDESLTVLTAGKSGYFYMRGWDEIELAVKERYEASPDPTGVKLEFDNYKIKVYHESAWAVYDQIKYTAEGEFISKNLEVRFLEKGDGEWKIVFLEVVFASSYDEEVEEGDIDSESEGTD
jgi:hypothetical protein